jgi:pantoate--beta-alanine ligase
MQPEIIRTVAALRDRVAGWRREGHSVGMVPTMGALHPGHRSLVDAAKRQSARVVVTLFVNPTQFAPTEDFSAYPRNEDADMAILRELGVDVLFAPSAEEMYPKGYDTMITVGGPSAGLETEYRPHFFAGVATIVAKLLLAGLPDRAFFGEKDYQQLLVVKRLVRDLALPTEIVGCPTVRDKDGLALSSRNAYLSPEDRARAPKLHAMLRALAGKLKRNRAEIDLAEARRALTSAGFGVDYLEVRNAETLVPVADWTSEPLRVLVAARLGKTRLIDNIAV